MHLENAIEAISDPICRRTSCTKPQEVKRRQSRGTDKNAQNKGKNVEESSANIPKDAENTPKSDETAATDAENASIVNRDVEKAEGFVDSLTGSDMSEPIQPPAEPPPKAKLCCSVRLMTAFIALGALFLNYSVIFSLSFAILCMVKQTGRHARYATAANSDSEFDWDRTTQGLVLSAFYIGFATTLIIGGFVADLYNAKLVLVVGNLVQGVLSILLPEFTRLLGAPALGVLRILQGLASGVVVPCVYVLLSKWAASVERTRLLGIAYLGIPLSEMIIYPMSGAICTISLNGGWPFIFYIIGIVTVIFTAILHFFVHEWPPQHPFASAKEKAFLEYYSVKPAKKKKPPWKAMAKSGAVWSYCLCYCSQQWGFQVMSVFTPDFMQDVMKFNLHENGFLSSVPYIGMLIMRITQTSVFNWVREHTNLSLTTLRKVNHAIGTLVPAVSLICMIFVEDSPAAAVILLTVNMTIQDLAFTGGFGFCNVDFAPAFAGILSGIGMSVSIALCIPMPNIVTALTPHGTHSEWMVVFYITAASYVMAFIVYNRFGTSELQPWGMNKVESPEAPNKPAKNSKAKENRPKPEESSLEPVKK